MKKYLLLSDYLNISPEVLKQCNILNSFVNDDSGYYICLEEFKNSNIPEFANYENQYQASINLIRKESPEKLKKTLFSEPKYICLGESLIGHKGKGMQLIPIKAIKQEISSNPDYYLNETKLIELAHVSKKIGRDSLNDFLSNVYIENLLQFTENKCSELNIRNLSSFSFNNKSYMIRVYYENENIFPVVFFPQNVMKKYIYALTYNDLYDLGYEIKTTFYPFDKNASELKKEEFINKTPVSILSDKIKKGTLNYSSFRTRKTLEACEKYNNLDVYSEIKDDLLKISIPNIKDEIYDVVEYIYSLLSLILSKIMNKDIALAKPRKIIISDNYKQAAAFVGAKINELLICNVFQTKIIITRGGLFVIKNEKYHQICIRTSCNKSCVKDISTHRKLKAVKYSTRIDYKIIICDPNKNFQKYTNYIPANKKRHFLVLSI